MIALGACIASREKFLRYAMPGISLVAEPDSEITEVTTDHSIFEAYNEVLEAFAGRKGLEALILLHEDTEIVDPDMFAKVRERLARRVGIGPTRAQMSCRIKPWNSSFHSTLPK